MCPSQAVVPPLTKDTVVLFEGEPTLFGNLWAQERSLVEWDEQQGCYVGSYPY